MQEFKIDRYYSHYADYIEAQSTGHEVQTLYENYVGDVNSRRLLPEF